MAPIQSFFNACFLVVERRFAYRSCYFVGSTVFGTLTLLAAICGSSSSLNGQRHLFDSFSIILGFIALISCCLWAFVLVVHPLYFLCCNFPFSIPPKINK